MQGEMQLEKVQIPVSSHLSEDSMATAVGCYFQLFAALDPIHTVAIRV